VTTRTVQAVARKHASRVALKVELPAEALGQLERH